MSLSNKNTISYQDVPCPFCSLICDDLEIKNQGGKLSVTQNGCHKARGVFEREQSKINPRIKGKNCSLEEAIGHAVKILKQANQPLIAGLGTDINGMRAVMALAEKTGAIIDHMYSDGAYKNIKVLQDHGWIMTTLAEIKNRADLIIFAGTDAASNYPRFFERAVWNENSLAGMDIKKRQIIYIGENLDTSHGKTPNGKQPTYIPCKQEQIGEIIAILHALVVGNKVEKTGLAGTKLTDLEKLAVRMKQAKYGVIVWAPGELNFPHAELTVLSISELIKFMNRSTRYAGFSLGGNDGGMSAQNVSTWQSGYPLRVSYSNGYPDYDPHKYSATNVLKRHEVDAMVWISSFGADSKPPKARIPSIILADTPVKMEYTPDVYIPVATPGLDHTGQMIRTDSVVSLSLKQIRESKRMSVSGILNRVLLSLGKGNAD
jgi:formylmethanofuran dehydrogenase subunit B